MSKSPLRPLLPSTLLLPTLTPPFSGLIVDSILSEVFNIKVSDTAIRLNLDEPLVKFGESKEDLDVLYLEANRFLMVRLLKSGIHNWRNSSEFRSKKIRTPADNLNGLINPLILISSIAWSLIPMCLRSLDTNPKRTQSWHTCWGLL